MEIGRDALQSHVNQRDIDTIRILPTTQSERLKETSASALTFENQIPTYTMPPKRTSATATSTPRRQSTRQKVPVTKSPYFDHPSESDGSEGERSDTGSDFEEAKSDADASPEDDEDAVEAEEEEEEKPAKSSKKRSRRSSNAAASQSKPAKMMKLKGKEVFIPFEQSSAGDIDDVDDQIHPSTLVFLADLARNNNRGWLHERDSIYRAAKGDFEKFVECISELMPERVDETIPSELPVRDLVFRIHRDIRFSNDHTPYKTHFSAAWSRTGRKGPYACYYLQIKPGQSLAGGGLWHPEAQALAMIRRSIDQHPERLKQVVTAEEFATKFYGKLPRKDEKTLVQAFVAKNSEDALKTAPKNYSKDHKDIELLRLKSFTISKPLADKDVLSPGFLDMVVDVFKHMEPLVS